MKQHEFIWLIKQYPIDQVYMMDNGQTVAKIKDILLIHIDGELTIRFVEYNENYIIPDRKALDQIMTIVKKSKNIMNLIYTYSKEHFVKK